MAQKHSRLIWVILILIAFFVGYLVWQSQQTITGGRGPGQPVAVMTALASYQPMIRNVNTLGTGIANHSIQLTAPASDFLVELHVNEGQFVEQGHIIARLNDVQQRARVTELDAVLVDQRRQLERLTNLATTQATAQSMLDEQQTRVNTTLAQLDIARSQLADMTIKAPFSGYLGLRNVSQGAFINSGTVLTSLDDMHTLRVEFSVAERFLAELAVGMPITITNAAYGNTPFVGNVSAIDTRLDPITRSIRVHGSIDNSDLRLRPGMLLNVQLQLEKREALQISEKALVPQQDRQYVFVVDQDNKVRRVEVQLGQRIPGWVEIVSGLNVNDEIVIEGTQKIRNGITVNKVGS